MNLRSRFDSTACLQHGLKSRLLRLKVLPPSLFAETSLTESSDSHHPNGKKANFRNRECRPYAGFWHFLAFRCAKDARMMPVARAKAGSIKFATAASARMSLPCVLLSNQEDVKKYYAQLKEVAKQTSPTNRSCSRKRMQTHGKGIVFGRSLMWHGSTWCTSS